MIKSQITGGFSGGSFTKSFVNKTINQNNDASMNQTYIDGSVIIHTGNNPPNQNTDMNYTNTEESYNPYYGVNEGNMDTNVNIS